jgi:hypothetical protein
VLIASAESGEGGLLKKGRARSDDARARAGANRRGGAEVPDRKALPGPLAVNEQR